MHVLLCSIPSVTLDHIELLEDANTPEPFFRAVTALEARLTRQAHGRPPVRNGQPGWQRGCSASLGSSAAPHPHVCGSAGKGENTCRSMRSRWQLVCCDRTQQCAGKGWSNSSYLLAVCVLTHGTLVLSHPPGRRRTRGTEFGHQQQQGLRPRCTCGAGAAGGGGLDCKRLPGRWRRAAGACGRGQLCLNQLCLSQLLREDVGTACEQALWMLPCFDERV